MPLFPFFAQISNEQLKKNANKGYEKECIEIGYRYLEGSDGVEKSLTEAIRYLKPVVEAKKTEHLKQATVYYIKALIVNYTTLGQTEIDGFKIAISLLNHLIRDKSVEINEREISVFFRLMQGAYKISGDAKPIENYLKACIQARNSHFSYFYLGKLYASEECGFPKKPKKAILYYLKAFFISSKESYCEKSLYGKTQSDYLLNTLEKITDKNTLACWCISALIFVADDSKDYKEKMETILETGFIKDYFDFKKVSSNYNYYFEYESKSIKVNFKSLSQIRDTFLKLALIHTPYSTISMLMYAYEENLLSEEIFCEFFETIIKDKKQHSIPDSQIDKLRFRFFSHTYTKESQATDRVSILLKLSEMVSLVSNAYIDDKKSALIAELTMELLITNHPDCIIRANKLYEHYGEILNQFKQFKEGGLKVILQNKQDKLLKARLQLITELFDKLYSDLKICTDNQQFVSLLVPDVFNKLQMNLKNPGDFLNANPNILFDEQKISLLTENINTLKTDISLVNKTVKHLDIFKQRLNHKNMKNLIQEIDLAKESCQGYQKIISIIDDFQNALIKWEKDKWKKELSLFMEDETEIKSLALN